MSPPTQHGPGIPPPLTTSLWAGFARRFRLKAVQTSKACNVPSLYTCLVPVDSATQAALPATPEVWGTGTARGGSACWGGDSEGTEVALSLAAGSASWLRATAAGSWPHRSSSAGLGQQRDREEQDEAPIAAGTDPDPYIGLCSLGTCLSTGALGTLSSWLWNAVGGQEEASVSAPHCGGAGVCVSGGSVAAPGSSSMP